MNSKSMLARGFFIPTSRPVLNLYPDVGQVAPWVVLNISCWMIFQPRLGVCLNLMSIGLTFVAASENFVTGLELDTLGIAMSHLAKLHKTTLLFKKEKADSALFQELRTFTNISALVNVFLGSWPDLLKDILEDDIWTEEQRKFLYRGSTDAEQEGGLCALMKHCYDDYKHKKVHQDLEDILGHGDLWTGNLYPTQEKLFFLDFQFITLGYVHCDIWFLLYSSVR